MHNTDSLALRIWNYLKLSQPLEKTDCILILCSNDIRVAEYAAGLFLAGWAPLLVISGGISHQDDLLKDPWDIPTADRFAQVAIERGVPSDKILLENKSKNTGENITFTKELLAERNLDPQTFIVVQKPYMLRRAFAALMKQWPNKKFIMTSPSISFEEYPNEYTDKEKLINIMVGDLQRIREYPMQGFQIEQDIPVDVWDAYLGLVEMGYTKHLVKN